jgi:hypothetical protein
MIPWEPVVSHLVWIGGLATAIAVFSRLDWQSAKGGPSAKPLSQRLAQHPGLVAALATTWLGFGLAAPHVWERVAGFAIAIGLAGVSLGLWIQARNNQ